MTFAEAYEIACNSAHCMYRPKGKRVLVTNACSLPSGIQKTMFGGYDGEMILRSMMVTITGNYATVYMPSYEDIIASDWQTGFFEEPEKKARHLGLVSVSDSDLETAIHAIEDWGVGRVVGQNYNGQEGVTILSIESHLFDPNKDGYATPVYNLQIDMVNQTVTAQRVMSSVR